MSILHNDLSFWFPILKKSGVPVPRTEIVFSHVAFEWMFDGDPIPPGYPYFLNECLYAISRLGGCPVFMRTGHTSGKHNWKRTCYLEHDDDLSINVTGLLEYSPVNDVAIWGQTDLALPVSSWVFRELLPLDTAFEAFAGRMPINRERRYFFRDGEVICHHPYWPEDAIADRRPSSEDWRQLLSELNQETPEEVAHLTSLTLGVAAHFQSAPGVGEQGWSLDWAKTKDGKWYAIDMALARYSYHHPGCEKERECK